MAAPITIRTVQDINDNLDRIEALAKRSADAIRASLDDYGWLDAGAPSEELLSFLVACMAAAMVDEPATGEAVDIAGERFRSEMAAELGAALLLWQAEGAEQ